MGMRRIAEVQIAAAPHMGTDRNLQSVTTMYNPANLPYYKQPVHDQGEGNVVAALSRHPVAMRASALSIPPGSNRSLYQACIDPNDNSAGLYVGTPVRTITRNMNGTVSVFTRPEWGPEIADSVVITCPIWSTQLSIVFRLQSTNTIALAGAHCDIAATSDRQLQGVLPDYQTLLGNWIENPTNPGHRHFRSRRLRHQLGIGLRE